MDKYVSGRQRELKVGISSYSENKTVIQTIGKVGIGTTDAEQYSLKVIGDANITGILTANLLFGTLYGQFIGDSIAGTSIVGTSLSISGIGTIETLDTTTGTIDFLSNSNLNNTGIATLGITSITQLYVSGISTFNGAITGTISTATKLQNARTFEITGDVVASPVFFDGTGNVSLAATIQPNSVGLGTDTFGDYVETISGTAGQIVVTGGSGERSTPVIAFDSNPTIGGNVTIGNDLQVNNNLNVSGNITIGGTSAYILADSFRVSDADIILGFTTDSNGNDVSNDTTANHGGIAVASTEGNPLVTLTVAGIETLPPTYKKFMWFKAGAFAGLGTDAWLTNYAIGIGSTQFPTGTRLAVGSVQVTENDLAVVRNINASGIITATTFSGNATSATYAEYANTSGVSTSVIGGIASVTQLNVSGISTLESTTLIGGGTSTGTAGQVFQITGISSGAYIGGNLGIGIADPQTKVEINGVLGFTGNNIRIGDVSTGSSITSGSGNAFFGVGAGRYNTTGFYNTFIGQNAGLYNTFGSDNNFFGRNAGFANTTGCHNNFFGNSAGRCNTTGTNNNFLGLNAGCSNTTGNSNNFFGINAGLANTTGCYNNFFGRYAGRCNTTGCHNNFIGSLAGCSNTTGTNNNFFGQCAGRCNTTGSNNNFFGLRAGGSNTTGSYNTFFGSYAGCLNTFGCFNTFIGTQAGRCNTTGCYNTFIGCGAGLSNTFGFSNTFIGCGAGLSNTTGSNNNFIGRSAGRNNTFGSYNNFFGPGAGLCNTTGCHNNFFGRYAGRYTTTGCHNTFIGRYAGRNNTTGSNNNFFGLRAGGSNTTGSYNNFFGCYAGRYNTTGCHNTFIGRGAGFYNTTGSNNNFFGRYAGRCNTTGSCNNFFGCVAGSCNTTGSNNTFIGRGAGFYNTTGNNNFFAGQCAGCSNTTGSQNIVIGHNQNTPITSGDNQLVIGAGSTSWIVGNSSYNIGIGTTNPTSKLHVGGDVLVSGIHTAAAYYVDSTKVIDTVNSQVSLVGIATLDATTKTTFERELALAPNDFDSLNVSGVSTFTSISIGGTTGNNQYVLTSTGQGLSWQYVTGTGAITGINIAPDTIDASRYISFINISAGSTAALYVDNTFVFNPSTKRVGIGSTTPTSKLDVLGDVKVSGAITATTFSGNATSATSATYAGIAGLSTFSGYADVSGIATYASTAGIATYATSSGIATYASTAGIATYASTAGIATYATSSGIATYASTAGIATYASTAGIATSLNINDLPLINDPQSGDFIALYDVSGAVVGKATIQNAAGSSETINATNDTSSTVLYPVMVASAGSNQTAKVTTTANYLSFNASTGQVTAIDFNSASDMSLKNNVIELSDSIETLKKLSPVSFNWENTGDKSYGLIAQEVEKILPELVSETNGVKSVRYIPLIAMLINAIVELDKKIS